MPPTPAASGASTDVLTQLSTWLGAVLNDIIRVFADAEGANIALAEQGWNGGTPVLPGALLARLDQEAQAGNDPSMRAAESFAEVLVALGALGDALIAASGPEASGISALELVADQLDLAMSLRMREDHPALWAVLRLLNLISDDGAQLANLGDLVGDAHRYLSGLVSGPGYAQAYQDYSLILAGVGTLVAFIPPSPKHGSQEVHGHDKSSFRSEALYGWTTAGATDHPNLAQLVERTLTWRLDWQAKSTGDAPAAEEIVDVTLALVPAEHNRGAWGLFVRLAGATTFTIPLGTPKPPDAPGGEPTPTGWQLSISSTDAVPLEALFGGNGFVRFANADSTSGYKASIAIERPDDVSGSWVIGGSRAPQNGGGPDDPPPGAGADTPVHGTHVEIQHARVALTISDDGAGWHLDTSAHADHIIFDIEVGRDSFLRAVLPPSIRIDTILGLGVDTKRGFYLDGGVALVVDLPAHVVLGPADVLALVLQGFHLRIGLTGADPGGDGKSGASFTVGLTLDASVQVAGGVFIATVAGVGAQYVIKQVAAGPATNGSQTAGHWQPKLTGVPPNGLGIVIKAGPVGGGGYIGYDADRSEYTGALQLHIALAAINVDVVALGMLDTKIPGHDGDWALILILAARFDPGLQLGFGIALSGLGGMLGINHTLDSDAIAAGLRTKSLDTILFPPDPVAQAPHIFAVWRQTMPLADGHTVVGPMVRLSWGSGTICSLELAVLIELDPSPVQIILLGSFRLTAPTEDIGLVRLRADLLGRLKFDPLDFMLEAELVDSRLGTFTISGGLVFVARGGDDAAFVLSVGGFNPHFTPPDHIPVPDRLRVDISGSDNPRLRLEAYVAITSQSFQFGARAELHAAAGPLAVDGWLGLDALIEWLPHFRFSAEISAGLSLSYDGSPILEISIDVLLEGPGPWHVHGHASLSLLFVTLSLPIDARWGDDAGPTAPTAQPLTLVRDALSAADAWSASLPPGRTTAVVFRTPTGPIVPAHPLAVVACRQRIVPLGMSVTHVGNQPLDAPTTVDVTALQFGGAAAPDVAPVTEEFAAAQFLDLRDDEKLSRPSFEPMRAGLAAGGGAVDVGNATVVATTYKTIAVDGATRVQKPRWLLTVDHANAVLRPADPPLARAVPPRVTTVADTLRTVAGDGAAPATATLAAQRAAGARLFDAVGVAGGAG